MKIAVSTSDISAMMREIEGDIAGAATGAMAASIVPAKQELRNQVVAAGLGNRLANTWRGETYPRSRRSVTPAGYIWSRAPDIIDSYARGATITARAGRRYLAIPSTNVPRVGGRGSSRRMSPEQVEHAFNADLFFEKGANGRLLAFIKAVSGRSRGVRAATKGRRAQGRVAKPVFMFTLVPTVRKPKALDLDAVAQRWSTRFEADFTNRLGA